MTTSDSSEGEIVSKEKSKPKTIAPREWWILPDGQGFGKINIEPYRNGNIHVIEHSAFQKCVEALKALPHQPLCAIVGGYGYCNCIKGQTLAEIGGGE